MIFIYFCVDAALCHGEAKCAFICDKKPVEILLAVRKKNLLNSRSIMSRKYLASETHAFLGHGFTICTFS